MMHIWGDGWQYWDDLYKAEKYFNDFYERCTGKHPCTKEKWGEIRYECAWNWLTTFEDARIFKGVLQKTVQKYPQVAAELCTNAWYVIDDLWFEGWCRGVCFKSKLDNKNKGCIDD